MAVKVEVKLDVPSVTDFTIHHICSGKIGIFRNVLGVLNVALAVAFLVKQQIALAVVFALFAAFVLGGLKMIIRNRVTKQMEHSNRLSMPVTYEFSEKGILTTTESDSGMASWDAFKRAVTTKKILILYSNSGQAIILPLNQIEVEYKEIADLIYENMPAPAVRVQR